MINFLSAKSSVFLSCYAVELGKIIISKTVLMKKISCVVLATFCFFSSFAVPGDTTWVQAQNDTQMPNYGDYNQPVSFPDGTVSYRKIIMVFTLGKYTCPSGSQYCGDWDYTVQNFVTTSNNETFELGRLITPYAGTTWPRTPMSWKERYFFDVTDFYTILKNAATIRTFYQGYSGGFTANIKFAFIEGTPPRNVTGIQRLWNGSFAFGSTTDPIDSHVAATSFTAPANTQSAEVKYTLTGHGSDNNGCSEFCAPYYQFRQNNVTLEQKTIWRDNCGSNHLYPQSGTWVYNRGNWCPGDFVLPTTHKISNITAGVTSSVNIHFQPYTTPGGSGTSPVYIMETALVFYGAYNYNLDASIEDVISPSDNEAYYRLNPVCGGPVIKVKNTGNTPITSVQFEYSIVGSGVIQTYSSNTAFASGETKEITLAPLTALMTVTGSNNVFNVKITGLNGVADDYVTNNEMSTFFETAAVWPANFKVGFKPNSSKIGSYSETKWRIEDLAGNIIRQRINTTPNIVYWDTLNLPEGCYSFIVEDGGCNGLYWWANSSAGTGALQVNTIPSNALVAIRGLFGGDFGCGLVQNFRVSNSLFPLHFLSFSGERKNSRNSLNWTTVNETNSDHFDVEYSTNGSEFIKVGEVKSTALYGAKGEYSYLHVPAVSNPAYFYRLKQVDKDGKFQYSPVILLKDKQKNLEVSFIKPNPFKSVIDLGITAETNNQPFKLNIYDALGRLSKTFNKNLEKGSNTVRIDGLENLSHGYYFLEVKSLDKVFTEKIIKN